MRPSPWNRTKSHARREGFGIVNLPPCYTAHRIAQEVKQILVILGIVAWAPFAAGDGLRLAGKRISVRGGLVAACEGRAVVAKGTVRIDGLRVTSCRLAGLHVGGDVLIANCLVLHNRGPAVTAEEGAAIRFYHNLVYDNSGGPMLDACRHARALNNIFVNNFATARQPPHLGAVLLPAGHVRDAGALVGPVLLQQRGAGVHFRGARGSGRGGLREPHRAQQHLCHG
jgi:hypothetical protein